MIVDVFQEYEIDKSLNIKGPEDVAKMGIEEYNKQCRSIVMRYANEWEVRVCVNLDVKQTFKVGFTVLRVSGSITVVSYHKSFWSFKVNY